VDVESLAGALFVTQDKRRLGFLWHHFVLAVGNFKRQPGRRLYPAALTPQVAGTASCHPDQLVVPVATNSLEIGKLDEDSWDNLKDALKGAGVATVTTLLAALWPDEHVVFDWRVHAAANGLRLHAARTTTDGVKADSTESVPITLPEYKVVRRWVVDQARVVGRQPCQVERSLYRLSQDKTLRLPRGKKRTWSVYGRLVGGALVAAGPVPEASGHEDDEPDDEEAVTRRVGRQRSIR
jgi:hypothetical protein